MTAIPAADVALICTDGTRYPAHSSVLVRKSDKLAACLRFAAMSSGTGPSGGERTDAGCREIPVDAPPQLVAWMLQHMYHGSVLLSESRVAADPAGTAGELLELLLVAEELLCDSLMQECEMRLLSSEPWLCYCDACACLTGALAPTIPRRHRRVRGPSLFLERVDGGGGVAATALDALAVAQYVHSVEKFYPEDGHRRDGNDDDQSGPSGRYQVLVSWTSADKAADPGPASAPFKSEETRCCAVPALVALRYTAAKSLLRNLGWAEGTRDGDPAGAEGRDSASDARLSPSPLLDPADEASDQYGSQSDLSACRALEGCVEELAGALAALVDAAATAARQEQADPIRGRGPPSRRSHFVVAGKGQGSEARGLQ
jgi:hypothetical protein